MSQSVQNLIVFAKRPVWGKVKSRLAEDIGEDKALEIYQDLLHITIDTVTKWQNGEGIKNVFWFWDQINEDSSERIILPDSFEIFFQGEGDLGEKMSLAFEEVFNTAQYYGYNLRDPFPIAIIGTDCPSLSVPILESCFDHLEENEIVIGPAEDGGYYLLAMQYFYPEIFWDVEWSTEKVFRQTIENIKKNKIYFYKELPVLRDIDRVEDLPY